MDGLKVQRGGEGGGFNPTTCKLVKILGTSGGTSSKTLVFDYMADESKAYLITGAYFNYSVTTEAGGFPLAFLFGENADLTLYTGGVEEFMQSASIVDNKVTITRTGTSSIRYELWEIG